MKQRTAVEIAADSSQIATPMNWSRTIAAALVGFGVAFLTSSALSTGVEWYHSGLGETNIDEWGILFWGDHWFARAVTSVVATAWAGFIAAVVARSHGGRVAMAASAPGAIIWVVVALLFNISFPWRDRLLAAVLAVSIPFIARAAGNAGEIQGQGLSTHFDVRRRTLLGIRWYHFLWLPFALNLVIAQSAWTVLYAFEWLKVAWAGGAGILSIVPGVFLAAVYGTLLITVHGWSQAYGILAGLRRSHRPVLDVIKYGFGYPIVAVGCQAAIQGIHGLFARWLGGTGGG